ncbi:A24 family peptidase [Bacteriovorax sp. Seq25_V]|uniref:prepilin peptidase n=1 Tax=Bacteriovorax sp. Seq25_V TaxID=1201288 RepID=UPI000389F0DF|nr:A24 family peptidase [Bacteriovorax sp. Seq25_V]EQC43489.1 peptidase, A24 type IV prepilin peptidase family protein [Bacteriovorax sp. Seq25_V]
MEVTFYKTFTTIFGLLVGSFLNVLIHRIPLKENFVIDRSRCPKCNYQIKWYENLPVISYIFLLGKCRNCKTSISFRYPLVEMITGFVAFLLFPKVLNYSHAASSLLYFSIFCALLVHFFIDLKHKILPDGINIYLGICFFVLAVTKYHYMHWLVGGLIGFLFPLGVTYLFYILRNQVGLGGGDIKLFGVLGLFLGPIGIIHNILFSCILGSVIGLPLMAFKIIDRKTAVPFGPFIIIVAIAQIYFPEFFKSFVSLIF